MRKLFIAAALLLAGCAYHRVKINVPGCGVSTVKLETSCEAPRPHYPEGVEVLCHDFVMTDNGPVTQDRIVVYHCIHVQFKENEK